jgi:hypothetical protein
MTCKIIIAFFVQIWLTWIVITEIWYSAADCCQSTQPCRRRTSSDPNARRRLQDFVRSITGFDFQRARWKISLDFEIFILSLPHFLLWHILMIPSLDFGRYSNSLRIFGMRHLRFSLLLVR